MKKRILILLIILAIPLYSYNIYLLVRNTFSPAEKTNLKNDVQQSFDQLIHRSRNVVFTKKDRSPFSSHKDIVAVKNIIQEKRPVPVPVTPRKQVTKPSITLTGIMWSPKNPLAMILLPDGTSAIGKEGGIYGTITIKKIEQNRIQVLHEKNLFWIER
jgi:hypothetical protein